MIALACSNCRQPLQVAAELAGKQAQCPRCNQVVSVPDEAIARVPASTGSGTDVGPSWDTPSVATQSLLKDGPEAGAGTSPVPRAADHDFLAAPREPGEMGRLGAYRVLKVLGSGGMGVVFLAEDPHLERRLALKAMKPALAASDSARLRFLREARAAASIKHDHIIGIYQVGEERGLPFLAMEYLEGESLEDHVRRDGKLAVPEVLRIGREIAEGLDAAHRHGLVHRDIKPANIWLEAPRRRVRLLDFGLARAAGDDAHLTQSGAIVGTPAYMAPEQARAETVDGRSDLFSLGCVLYRLCTGQLPFQGRDAMSTLLSLALETPRPVRELNGAVPPALAELILRLLAKDPAHRPASAREVADRLAALANDEGGATAPPCASGAGEHPAHDPTLPGHQPSTVSPPRKRRFPAVAFAATFFLVVGATALVCIVLAASTTGYGSVTLRSDDPGARVALLRAGKEVVVLDAQAPSEVSLATGTYECLLRQGRDGLQLSPRQFTLARGGAQRIEVIDGPSGGPVLPEQLARHSGPVYAVAFSPDGKTLASASADRTVRLWDTERFAPRQPCTAHTADEVVSVAFFPDGKALAGIAWDAFEAIVWDAETGSVKRKLPRQASKIRSVAVSPSGDALALAQAAPGNGVSILDAVTGEQKHFLAGHSQGVWCVTYSRDGTLLASASNDWTVRIWDARTGENRKTLTGHGHLVKSVAFSPDGKTLASGSADSMVRIWDVNSGKSLKTLTGHMMEVVSVAFSPDGTTLVSGSMDGTIRVWDVHSGDTTRTLKGHKERVLSVAISPDGKVVASGGSDGRVRLWRLK